MGVPHASIMFAGAGNRSRNWKFQVGFGVFGFGRSPACAGFGDLRRLNSVCFSWVLLIVTLQ